MDDGVALRLKSDHQPVCYGERWFMEALLDLGGWMLALLGEKFGPGTALPVVEQPFAVPLSIRKPARC